MRDHPDSSASPTPPPPRVARSEDELIRLARGLLGSGRPLPRARAARPITQIGPTAMALLQQTLARGTTLALLRRGGWETRRMLVDGQPRRGRLWQRHGSPSGLPSGSPLPPLRFGPASFALLTWLHREDLVRPTSTLERDPDTTATDDLLHFFACEQLVRAGLDVHQPAFRASPLCQLAFPDALALPGPSPLPAVDFEPWTRGLGAVIVEALQTPLARCWLAMERRKGGIVQLEEMTRIGAGQAEVLGAWLAAVSRVPRGAVCGRRDLASFIAEAARVLLGDPPGRAGQLGQPGRGPDHRWWVRSLSLQAPLAARQAAFTAAGALLRAIVQLGVWLDEAGLVAHFDDDYEAAQLLLSSWQFLRVRPSPATLAGAPASDPTAPPPSSILDRAAALLATLESLHSLGIREPERP